MDESTKVAIFKGKRVRKIIYQNEWYFSVVDVVEALTDSNKPRVYWNAMKTRVKATEGIELSTICRQLKLEASDGKKYETDCANTEGIFRIIQSITSPKAEPFKRWLARQGGAVAGNAKRELEQKSGQKVSTSGNYLKIPQKHAYYNKKLG